MQARRSSPRGSAPRFGFVVAAALFSAAVFALVFAAGHAQADSTGIAADRFVPAPNNSGFLGIESAEASPRFSVTASLSGATHLIAVDNNATKTLFTTPLAGALTLDLGGEVALTRRFSVGLGMPLALVLRGDRLDGLGDASLYKTPVVGDVRLRARVLLYGLRGGLFRIAGVIVGTVPGGGESQFFATAGPTVEPRMLFEFTSTHVRAALLAGVRFAPPRQFLDEKFENEAHLGAAIDARLVASRRRGVTLHALAETEAALGGPGHDNALEVRGGARIEVPHFEIDGGAGFGALPSPTNPALRLFLTLRAER